MMKKFLLIACCASCVMACNQKKTSTVEQKKTDTTQRTAVADNPALRGNPITLNGIDSAKADSMVRYFQKSMYSDDKLTNIWFKKSFVDEVLTVLQNEKGDGIRLYIGKDSATKHNTIVIMYTKDAGDDTTNTAPPTAKIHQDYFVYDAGLLSLPGVKSQKDNIMAGSGADLYTTKPCPPDNCNITQNYVSCREAHAWAQNFKGGKLKKGSVWYSIDLIKALKAELTAADSAGKKTDGIRIYFIKKLNGDNGFIFTPTQDIGNNISQDYYECYSHFILTKTTTSDHGEECPIFCKGAKWGQ